MNRGAEKNLLHIYYIDIFIFEWCKHTSEKKRRRKSSYEVPLVIYYIIIVYERRKRAHKLATKQKTNFHCWYFRKKKFDLIFFSRVNKKCFREWIFFFIWCKKENSIDFSVKWISLCERDFFYFCVCLSRSCGFFLHKIHKLYTTNHGEKYIENMSNLSMRWLTKYIWEKVIRSTDDTVCYTNSAERIIVGSVVGKATLCDHDEGTYIYSLYYRVWNQILG